MGEERREYIRNKGLLWYDSTLKCKCKHVRHIMYNFSNVIWMFHCGRARRWAYCD